MGDPEDKESSRHAGAATGAASQAMEERLAARKRAARLVLDGRVKLLSKADRDAKDASICRHIIESRLYRSAAQVLLYHALSGEVSIAEVAERAYAEGRRLFLPVTEPTSWEMTFASWAPGARLVRGAFGVMEPLGGEPPGQERSLILVPGRGFDNAGRRLGRGRGCYDRCLGRLAGLGSTVGVAYEAQVLDEIPNGPQDRRVHAIVTEAGLRICAPE